MPKITIITACYNASEFLQNSLDSIKKQTFKDYELLIIDDASVDNTSSILDKFISNNPLAIVINNASNIGLANSLNKAINNSDSEYIARFDADDLMYPERLATQIKYMEANNIDLVGSYVTSIGKYRRSKLTKYPIGDKAIRMQLLFQSAFCHPSTIFTRKALGDLRYDASVKYAEDYDLWVRMSPTTIMANIDRPLLYYRKHSQQISSNTSQQNHDAGKIRLQALKNLDIGFSTEEAGIHSHLRYSNAYSSKETLKKAEEWLIKLMNHFNDSAEIEQIKNEWYLCCVRATHFGLWTWKTYQQSILYSRNNLLNNFHLYSLCVSKIKYKSAIYNLLEGVI